MLFSSSVIGQPIRWTAQLSLFSLFVTGQLICLQTVPLSLGQLICRGRLTCHKTAAYGTALMNTQYCWTTVYACPEQECSLLPGLGKTDR